MKALVLVFLGGGLGSVLRYLISVLMMRWNVTSFPLGTLFANLLSCAILAGVLYWVSSKPHDFSSMIKLLLVTGFCGGLSTFSTFSFETFQLFKEGFYTMAILNIALSLTLCMSIIFMIFNKLEY